jgi:hypothetical protein
MTGIIAVACFQAFLFPQFLPMPLVPGRLNASAYHGWYDAEVAQGAAPADVDGADGQHRASRLMAGVRAPRQGRKRLVRHPGQNGRDLARGE